jgi:ribosomal protein L10
VPDEYLRAKGIKYIMIKNYIMFYAINENEKTVDVIYLLNILSRYLFTKDITPFTHYRNIVG